ncbi:MAG: hypothetical protein NC452_04215, partial [Eubacterium sp.]|nr:hypothetical protein [Eubacterium sp.]
MENVETIWSPFIITNAGLNIRQKAIASNETVTFNYAKIGQGVPNTSANIPLMTDIVKFAEQVEVVRTEAKEGNHHIGVRIDNSTFEQPVLMTEIGVFASIRNSEPVLYGYTYTTQGYDSIPSSDVSHYIWTIGIDTVLSRSQNISFSYDGSSLYVTHEDFNTHIEDSTRHLTEVERADWNGKADKTELDTHIADNVRHITSAERTAWNGKAAGSHGHGAATQSADGFMSASDKVKLDGIAAGANAYVHPVTSGNKHIPSGGASGQILRWSADG